MSILRLFEKSDKERKKPDQELITDGDLIGLQSRLAIKIPSKYIDTLTQFPTGPVSINVVRSNTIQPQVALYATEDYYFEDYA